MVEDQPIDSNTGSSKLTESLGELIDDGRNVTVMMNADGGAIIELGFNAEREVHLNRAEFEALRGLLNDLPEQSGQPEVSSFR